MTQAELIEFADKINSCSNRDELRNVINSAPSDAHISWRQEPKSLSKRFDSWLMNKYGNWASKKTSWFRCFIGCHRLGMGLGQVWRCQRCRKEFR